MIKTIIDSLKKEINKNLEEFNRLTGIVKELKTTKHNQQKLDDIYILLTEIAVELEPALPIMSFTDTNALAVIKEFIALRNTMVNVDKKRPSPLKFEYKKISINLPVVLLQSIRKVCTMEDDSHRQTRTDFIIKAVERELAYCSHHGEDKDDRTNA